MRTMMCIVEEENPGKAVELDLTGPPSIDLRGAVEWRGVE